MPGVYKYSIDRLNEVIDQAEDNKINLIAIFPNTPNDKKDENGSES
jgi:porphobilinogen synthase